MKLTISQFSIEPDIGANKDKMLSVIQSAGRNEWIIFPEGALSGYFPDKGSYFEELDRAELTNAMTEIADEVKRCGCYCLYGSATYGDEDWLNSVVIESHSGQRQLYHKIELSALDHKHFKPGREVPVYRLDGVTFGVQMCRELIFPEAWQSLQKQGAQVVFHINNALNEHDQIWRSISIARAVENANFVCSVNNGAFGQKLSSHVVSPSGKVILETEPSQEQRISVDVDLSEVIGNLANRRDY
ncbi:MAG: carbon-nitrogen hydrolase family protein [Planctomycetes bacterium]|nr:carbon-nitrogen hydrolase family protein [Planctomycetota bacterium]